MIRGFGFVVKAAGYQTVLAGKYMNGYHGKGGDWATYIPKGWTDWFGFQTVDFFGTQVNVNGVSTKYVVVPPRPRCGRGARQQTPPPCTADGRGGRGGK